MSEQIGQRRDAAFAEPRSERSTAVKCTQADHYISTTARSDTWVLPIRLSLFKSLSWTAVQMRVANRRPRSVLKGPSLLSEPNRFKYLYCFFSALSVHADSPPSLRNAFFLLPHCFAHHFVLPLTACLCVCVRAFVCVFVTVSRARPCVRVEGFLDQFCNVGVGALSFFTQVHGSEHKDEVERAAALQ